jgi:uncharacterized protein YjbI with pentapeptide repeats
MSKKTQSKIEPPVIPEGLAYSEPDLRLDSEQVIRLVSIHDREIEGQAADKVAFEKVRLSNVTFSRNELRNLEFTDVVFDKCDLSNADFRESNLHRVEFHQCKIMGLDMSESTLRNVLFRSCSGEYAVFRFANLKQTIFDQCSLQESDFYHAALQKVYFQASNINGAQMAGLYHLQGASGSVCEFDRFGSEGITDEAFVSLAGNERFLFLLSFRQRIIGPSARTPQINRNRNIIRENCLLMGRLSVCLVIQ